MSTKRRALFAALTVALSLWEGVRAAVDVRYATTLREAATSAIGSADPAAVALGEAARAWLEQVDILGDLGALRREMVDHILELQSSV